MKVKDFMSKPVTIDKSDRVSEALDLMDKQHVRRLIVRHNGMVMGIISLRSICGSLGSRRKYNHPPTLFHVADAVSNSFATLGPEDDAQQAIEALKQVDSVVVVDDGIRGAVCTSDVIKHVTPDGTVETIMQMPQIAPPDARVSFIRKLMMDKGVSRVPIMDGATLVGIVSETDVAAAFRGIKKHSPQERQDNNVERMLALDIMRTDVVTVPIGTSIREAAKLMIDRGIGALPVLNDKRHLVGIVTRRDIVRAI
jgi:CBS domain-containing protein